MKLPAFKLERFFAQYEFKAPYLLSSSDCEAMMIEELLSLEPDAAQRFHQTWLGYTETQGNPELRQAIAQTYQTIGIEQILVHAGAEEAVFIFMNIALQPGDHLIVHFPCYQSHRSIAQSIGCDADFFNWIAPKGGSTAFPSLKRSIDVEEFCIDLVNQQGVLLLPGPYFDDGKQNFRLGLGRKNLPTCLEKLEDYLKAIAA